MILIKLSLQIYRAVLRSYHYSSFRTTNNQQRVIGRCKTLGLGWSSRMSNNVPTYIGI